jgi:septal ring factor EnvC (AmiA/AmiB activator)
MDSVMLAPLLNLSEVHAVKMILVVLIAALAAAVSIGASPARAEDGTTRESIVKSRLKLQIGESKKLASMADRLASAGTIQRMNQRELESLQKQLQTDATKANKVLESSRDLREKDKQIDEQSKELESLQKSTARSQASVTKILESRTQSAKK